MATRRDDVRGFTLIELMVVLTLVVVISVLASPSFVQNIDRSRLKSQASDLVDVLEFAKSEGLKRSNVQTVITNPSGGAAWSVVTSTLDSASTPIESRKVAAANGITMLAPTSTQTQALNFRGIVTGYVSSANCADTTDLCMRLRSPRGNEIRVGMNAVGQITACVAGDTFGGFAAC